MFTAGRKHFFVDENGKPQSSIMNVETYNRMHVLIEDNEEEYGICVKNKVLERIEYAGCHVCYIELWQCN